MSEDEEIREYAELYQAALKDEVQFAKKILGFKPYPYQGPFLQDRSRKIAACCGRQVGKTTLTAIKSLHFTLANQRTQVLIVSAGLRQSMILFEKILDFISSSVGVRALVTEETRTHVKFFNGSSIVALPCGRDGSTLRGCTADMVILDECNFIPKIVINSVIRPTTITRPNSKIIMLSTPWVKDHPFHDAVTKPELQFHTYTWPSSFNPQITSEDLEMERKTMGEYDFNREYNAQFIDDQFSYFPSEAILACTDDYELQPEPRPGEKRKGEHYVGIDLGKKVDPSAIAVVEAAPNNILRLVYLREFPLKTQYTTVIEAIRNLHNVYEFYGGYIDETGVGEAPYEEIRKFAPIKGMTLTLKTKQDILGNLLLRMEDGSVTLPKEPPPLPTRHNLLTQLTQQQCHPTPDGSYKFTHPAGTHDDLAWAFALAVYAYPGPRDWMRTGAGVKRPE